MALPRTRPDSSWSDEIASAAREFFDGELTVSTPGTPGKYNPPSGTYAPGTPGETVISKRPARAQHLRAPSSLNDGNGWQTSHTYQFQCDILPGDASITKGLIVRFTGGRDPELAKMVFHVDWATNSSSAAVRTIVCSTEGGRVNGNP